MATDFKRGKKYFVPANKIDLFVDLADEANIPIEMAQSFIHNKILLSAGTIFIENMLKLRFDGQHSWYFPRKCVELLEEYKSALQEEMDV